MQRSFEVSPMGVVCPLRPLIRHW